MALKVREHFLHLIRMTAARSHGPGPGCLLRDIAAAAWLTCLSGGVLAQDAGSLLRERQRQQERQLPERLPKAEEALNKPALPAPPGTGETVLIKALRFTGKTDLLQPSERERIAAAIENKRAGIAGLQALADQVTATLQKQGNLLARALLAPQDLTAGVVTLDIAEGRLEQIDFEREKGVRIDEELLKALSQRAIAQDGVTRQALEEALLRMNDLPGVTARARLLPGATPNSSRLVVGVHQQPIFSAVLWGDNYGSPATGRGQGNALMTLADVSGLGDQTRVTGVYSRGQKFTQAEISLPLGASGVTTHASYGHLSYRNVDDLGRQAGLAGSANYVEAGLDYRVVRSRNFNLRLSATLDRKSLVDDTIAGRLQDKRSRSATLALAGELKDGLGHGALTSWSLGLTHGDLDLARVPAALTADAAGLNTQGRYRRLSVSLARLQALPADFALFTRVYGQQASKNLDSSEDFALGGPYGVRGWPAGEGRGDAGVLGSVELRYDGRVRAARWPQAQLSLFLDGGRVQTNRNPNGVPSFTACGCNTYSLASAGLGMRLTWARVSVSTYYAHGIGRNPGHGSGIGAPTNGQRHGQFWFQSAIRF